MLGLKDNFTPSKWETVEIKAFASTPSTKREKPP